MPGPVDMPIPDIPGNPLDRPPINPRWPKIVVIVLACGLLLWLSRERIWGPRPEMGLRLTLNGPTLASDGKQVEGSFRFDLQPWGFKSDGVGGACLVADIAGLVSDEVVTSKGLNRGSCSTDDECNPMAANQPWIGYCLPEASGEKRCWYKPTQNVGEMCERSKDHNGAAWPIGQDIAVPLTRGFDVKKFYADYTGGRPARWRLTGLMLSKDKTKKVTPVSDPQCLGQGNCN